MNSLAKISVYCGAILALLLSPVSEAEAAAEAKAILQVEVRRDNSQWEVLITNGAANELGVVFGKEAFRLKSGAEKEFAIQNVVDLKIYEFVPKQRAGSRMRLKAQTKV
ncbi:hypothetical protein [Roseibacillus ishigakijimensis]|uniref:Uncharacterized protein n=1 Tax=Roseibacillus ishigakijimensis TaxID=454146 RepID=A0A934RPJ8_9BACT|nr:hypothetical protein [Roseibacillus ishigakijimensis]MBK1835657.1 hypothetical protein [Roseibacillus ishigakijimensis]